MKIGVFDHFDADGGSLAALYEWRLKLVEAYDRSGIDIYHLAEHHSTPLGMAPSPSVFLSAVAQRTRRLRFGPMVYTLSLHHPLRVMEEICMLDQMSGGRVELGVGRGISPLESTFYGVDPKQSRDIYVEVLDILLKAFQTQSLDHEGKFYRFKGTPIVIAPLQKPYPPLWYGVLGPEGVDWPAQHAMNIATNALVPATREITDRYRAQWQAAGRDPAKLPLLGMSRHIVIAETDAEALALARRSYARWHESFTHLWRLHGVRADLGRLPRYGRGLDGDRHELRRLAGDGARQAQRGDRDNGCQLPAAALCLRRYDACRGAALGRAFRARGPAGPAGRLKRRATLHIYP